MQYMKTSYAVSGQKIKRAVVKSGWTKEQVVASVQDKGFRFSLTGLDKMFRNEFPVNDTEEILEAIALKCGCLISTFTEDEAQTA
jgi:hypothetical protein